MRAGGESEADGREMPGPKVRKRDRAPGGTQKVAARPIGGVRAADCREIERLW